MILLFFFHLNFSSALQTQMKKRKCVSDITNPNNFLCVDTCPPENVEFGQQVFEFYISSLKILFQPNKSVN